MAITKTKIVQRIEINVHEGKDSVVDVIYKTSYTDSDTNIVETTIDLVHLYKYEQSDDPAEGFSDTLTDITGEDSLVQSVCNTVWQ